MPPVFPPPGEEIGALLSGRDFGGDEKKQRTRPVGPADLWGLGNQRRKEDLPRGKSFRLGPEGANARRRSLTALSRE